MKVERTHDMDAVREILTDPAVWSLVSDDGCPDRHDFTPVRDTRIVYLLARDQGVPVGVFLLVPVNAVTWDVHCAMLPGYRGLPAVVAARLALDLAFAEADARKLTAAIPASNQRAVRFARALGFRQEGVSTRSFLKNGRLEDRIVFGIERETCLQQ